MIFCSDLTIENLYNFFPVPVLGQSDLHYSNHWEVMPTAQLPLPHSSAITCCGYQFKLAFSCNQNSLFHVNGVGFLHWTDLKNPTQTAQVPIRQRADALVWLQAQARTQHQALPRCFFSSRRKNLDSTILSLAGNRGESLSTANDDVDYDAEELVSVAGVGSAVFFQSSDPFTLHDWKSIRRYISFTCSPPFKKRSPT